LELLVHYLDLLVDHFPGEAIDRHVDPVSLFAIHDKAIREIRSIWGVSPALSDHID
jgi:hypothetical protein